MSNRLLPLAAALAFGLPIAFAQALDTRPLQGSYAIGSATLVDPPPDEKKDRLLLYLDGRAAKDTFEAMAVRAERSACDPDLQTKRAGGLECSKSRAGEHTCSVGVLLRDGRTVGASTC